MVQRRAVEIDRRRILRQVRMQSGFPEQCAKTFLFEMAVIGENAANPFAMQGLHRNAIGKAVAFVGTGSVEF